MIGFNGIFQVKTGDPSIPTAPGFLTGANPGFYVIPEPSTIALGILGGLGTLLLLPRRK